MQSSVTSAGGPAVAGTADGPVPTPGGPLSYIHWGPVVCGAITAAAVAFVLMTFASVVGLAVASPSPTWRDTSVGLALLSGVWILVVAIGSFALGGYLAGRVRSSWATTPDEIEFRDGAHGLLVWALAVVLAGLLTWATSSAVTAISATNTTAQRPAAGEPSFLAYELDRLFRSERRPDTVDPDARAEAGRILMTGLGRREMAADDRSYLVRLVSARTGLNAADADRRVGQTVVEARQANRQTRASAIIIGFMTAASLAAGAAAAWFAAEVGGRHRDQSISPPMRLAGWRRIP
jgi:hypothetical protein